MRIYGRMMNAGPIKFYSVHFRMDVFASCESLRLYNIFFFSIRIVAGDDAEGIYFMQIRIGENIFFFASIIIRRFIEINFDFRQSILLMTRFEQYIDFK